MPVDNEFRRFAVRVDRDLVFFAFTAGPGPACYCVCVTPHGFGAGFPCVGVRFYADAGGMVQPPDQPIPLYLGAKLSANVDHAAAGGDDGRVLTGIFETFVADGTDARLSQIIQPVHIKSPMT